jgi:hypothetical protein
MEITLENLVIVNGRILIEHVKGNIYQVIKVAKNMNFQGERKTIELLDFIILNYEPYSRPMVIDERNFYIITANSIIGYIKNDQ